MILLAAPAVLLATWGPVAYLLLGPVGAISTALILLTATLYIWAESRVEIPRPDLSEGLDYHAALRPIGRVPRDHDLGATPETKRTRGGQTPGCLTHGGKTVSTRTLPAALSRVQRIRSEMGTSATEMAVERLADARSELVAAMALLDSSEDRDLHLRVASHVESLDDLVAVLQERGRS